MDWPCLLPLADLIGKNYLKIITGNQREAGRNRQLNNERQEEWVKPAGFTHILEFKSRDGCELEEREMLWQF